MKKTALILTLICFFVNSYSQVGKRLVKEHREFIDQKSQTLKKTFQRSLLEPQWKITLQENYDVVYYGLDIKMNTDFGGLNWKTIIKAKARIENLNEVILDFGGDSLVTSVSGDGISYTHEGDILTVRLSRNFSEDELFTIVIEYTFPGSDSFTFRTHANGNPIISTFSEPFYARYWYPCKDLPGDKADSADINITVPDYLVASSNGVLREVENNFNGTKTYRWHEKYPITTYLISVAISDYETYSKWYITPDNDSMEVQFYVFPEYADIPTHGIYYCIEMIEVFSGLFGQYPFIEEKYAISQFTYNGGMEHQTNTSLSHFGESAAADLLAHHWWGNMITCRDWHNIWLNEGFAALATALWAERKYGKHAYNWFIDTWAVEEYEGSVYRNDISTNEIIFERIVFWKGALVLHMLRNVVGDETFFHILAEYRNRFAWKTAITEDFQKVCEDVYGQDLDWFFQQWIYGEGRPEYEYGWTFVEGDTANTVLLRIKQGQPGHNTFKMPLKIRISHTGGYEDIIVQNDSFDELYEIPVHFIPTDLVFDPENNVLKYLTEVPFDYSGIDIAPGIPREFGLTQNYPNPFNNQTNIRISLENEGNVSLKIYDITGREVRTLFNGAKNRGIYAFTWDGRDNLYKLSSSGVYFIRLVTENYSHTIKMIFLK
ncbi:M1 family aminopeptidase [candidate division KSB1 bacterium]